LAVPLDALSHVAIKARDVHATQRFYMEVLDLVLDDRPDVGFPGIWLKPRHSNDAALFHIYAGDAALEPDGSRAQGTGVIDHISIAATGLSEFRRRFRKFCLPWRENVVADAGLCQLFVYDPSAVLLELAFSIANEGLQELTVPPDLQYKPCQVFFRAEDYSKFASLGPSACALDGHVMTA
jgi:catechol 2,3-dioxygenase-like lactoylglutathione lyase family enzyme